MKRPVITGVVVSLIVLVTLAATAWTYYLHTVLLAPEEVSRVAGPQGKYYWRAAQFEIEFLRMQDQLRQYSSGQDSNPDALSLRYDLLKSRLHVLLQPVELPSIFVTIQRYEEGMASLQALMAEVDSDMKKLGRDPHAADVLLKKFDDNSRFVASFANYVHNMEMEHWDTAFEDFRQKRQVVYNSTAALLFIVAFTISLLVMNTRYRIRLIKQQKAALEAEQAATRKAQEAVKAKNVFLGMISHELRTPLQTIISSIDLLSDRKRTARDAKVFKRLETAALHLETQMKDLTDFARLEAGRLELRNSAFDPKELIQAVVDDHAPLAASRELSLTFSVADVVEGAVSSDPLRIRQIVTNLLTNALRYSEGGNVRVTLTRPGDAANFLKIAIEDTGPGISAEDLGRLFQPFTQLDQSGTRQHEGVGMGLAIVRGLVDLLGGSVHVDSEVGRGARFEVNIPVTPAPQVVLDQVPEQPHPVGHRVLVVDDRADIRETFQEMLEQMGYQCDVSSDAEQAIKRLSVEHYDVLLLDIFMPKRDGFSVASELRQRQGKNQHIPIVALTAYAHELAEPEARQLFDEYLMKPVRYETLRTVLRKFASSSRNRTTRTG